ncbi:proteoglycan 4-like [Morone saxatilis]|uniref:proteoglycan 4-like n=1 Tax=Morone saxatilis TaxID=34816 RepID=UPI0015E1ECC7|nr:proteoglycan 4-like [Morone saxatilis]
MAMETAVMVDQSCMMIKTQIGTPVRAPAYRSSTPAAANSTGTCHHAQDPASHSGTPARFIQPALNSKQPAPHRSRESPADCPGPQPSLIATTHAQPTSAPRDIPQYKTAHYPCLTIRAPATPTAPAPDSPHRLVRTAQAHRQPGTEPQRRAPGGPQLPHRPSARTARRHRVTASRTQAFAHNPSTELQAPQPSLIHQQLTPGTCLTSRPAPGPAFRSSTPQHESSNLPSTPPGHLQAPAFEEIIPTRSNELQATPLALNLQAPPAFAHKHPARLQAPASTLQDPSLRSSPH